MRWGRALGGQPERVGCSTWGRRAGCGAVYGAGRAGSGAVCPWARPLSATASPCVLDHIPCPPPHTVQLQAGQPNPSAAGAKPLPAPRSRFPGRRARPSTLTLSQHPDPARHQARPPRCCREGVRAAEWRGGLSQQHCNAVLLGLCLPFLFFFSFFCNFSFFFSLLAASCGSHWRGWAGRRSHPGWRWEESSAPLLSLLSPETPLSRPH